MIEPKIHYPYTAWIAQYVDARTSIDFDHVDLLPRRSFSLREGSDSPLSNPHTAPKPCALGEEVDS